MYAIGVEIDSVKDSVTTCSVSVSIGDNENEFVVTVDDAYHQSIDRDSTVEHLVKKSFEFLLDKEPPSSILKNFNLSEIEKYFPTYPQEIKKY